MRKFLTFLILFSLNFALFAKTFEQDSWTYIQVDDSKQKWGDWQQPDWLRYFGLDFCDVNGDGLKDIVSGRYIYHNPGDDMTAPWERITLDDNVDGILCVDIDGDAFADIIAQALPNIYWYEALDETGTKFKQTLIAQVPATGHVNSQGFEIGEIDGDGKPEILIAGNGDIYCISIPDQIREGKLFPTNLICRNTSDEGIGIGDIDGDGYNDIACGRRPEGGHEPLIAVWFENPGSVEKEWEVSQVGTSKHPMDRFKVIDLNGDGNTEIIVTEERYPGLEPDGQMYWFGRPANLKSEWTKNVIVTQYSMNNLDVADIDGDGDIDLVTNEHKGPNLELQIWENDGKANFTKHLIDTGKENHLGTMLVDLDGDGDLDIAGAAWDHYQYMHVWRNDSRKSFSNIKLFKEYKWKREPGGEPFLRVGGKLDYRTSENQFKDKSELKDGALKIAENIDLNGAIGAELIIEKLQSHDDTKNLQIQINNNPWMSVYEPPTIKKRAASYMYHFSPVLNVPLEYLKSGEAYVNFKLDDHQRWGWPQNIFYGFTLRIIYDDSKTDYQFQIGGLNDGDLLSERQKVSLINSSNTNIKKVDYIGFYKDINFHGDGIYKQWQYNWLQTDIRNHVGTSSNAPFEVVWNTSWIPDQKGIKLLAKVELEDGLVVLSDVIGELGLDRDYSIQLVKPYDVPENWATRESKYTEKLHVSYEKGNVDEAKLFWRSWSPGYSEGVTVNGILVHYENDWPHYAYMEHELDIDPLHLEEGENTLSTLKTALHDGQMVHGMEVQWPGIQLKVKSEKVECKKISITELEYEGRDHYRIETKNIVWYFDKAGGGFSRMIDRDGSDWISFKMKPWGDYPDAAAGAFRGFPNMVFGGENGGAGHPGHNQCKSWVEEDKIVTETLDGKWKWQYAFEDSHVMLDVLNVPRGETYWILYEGTPGGSFNPDQYFYGTSKVKPTNAVNDYYLGETKHEHFTWIFTSPTTSNNTLYMAQTENDKLLDLYGFLGNTKDGIKSPDGMTVFGLGRGKETNALMDKPQKYILGLYPKPVADKKSYKALSKYINSL